MKHKVIVIAKTEGGSFRLSIEGHECSFLLTESDLEGLSECALAMLASARFQRGMPLDEVHTREWIAIRQLREVA